MPTSRAWLAPCAFVRVRYGCRPERRTRFFSARRTDPLGPSEPRERFPGRASANRNHSGCRRLGRPSRRVPDNDSQARRASPTERRRKGPRWAPRSRTRRRHGLSPRARAERGSRDRPLFSRGTDATVRETPYSDCARWQERRVTWPTRRTPANRQPRGGSRPCGVGPGSQIAALRSRRGAGLHRFGR